MHYPYWRLSFFYLIYYACLGTWIPFWPLYLEYLGHAFWVIGVTSAIFNSTRIVAPNLWGYLSDRSGKRLSIIRYGCFFGFFAIIGMLVSSNLVWITCVLFVFSFFWSAVLPQFEVLTLNYMGSKNAQNYGRIRLWGSIGFVVAVTLGGWFFGIFPLAIFPWIICALLFMLWISSLIVPHSEGVNRPANASESSMRNFAGILKQKHIVAYLACIILMQISFGPYYTFFSLYLVDLGYPIWSIGAYWSVAIGAEILVFVYIKRLFDRFGVRHLMILSLILAVVRWFLLGRFGSSEIVMVLIQVLHAFSFGTFHACMIETIRRQFPSGQHGKAQAMHNSLGYGVGAVIGAALSGILWTQLTYQLFYLAAIVSGVALFIAMFVLRQEHFEERAQA